MRKLTTAQFISRAREIHGNKYDYSNSDYLGNLDTIFIRCQKHGDFSQRAGAHLLGTGCPKCAGHMSTEDFIKRAKQIHGDLFDYTNTKYTQIRKTVHIECRVHGRFSQRPDVHLKGSGCSQCTSKSRSYKESSNFIKASTKIHKGIYLYDTVDYRNAHTNVVIKCRIHGEFKQTPSNHLSGKGCQKCGAIKAKQFSNKAIRWIEQEAKSRRMKNVQHALNGGEFVIPETTIRADGYHKSTKTIFEFHGDCWHGNPDVFSPRSKPNPYSNKTARSLYKETCARTDYLRSLGYRVIEMWENDFIE
jgi:G:T-mismatch repair DNA endonuclease (very short patch repair protein)